MSPTVPDTKESMDFPNKIDSFTNHVSSLVKNRRKNGSHSFEQSANDREPSGITHHVGSNV